MEQLLERIKEDLFEIKVSPNYVVKRIQQLVEQTCVTNPFQHRTALNRKAQTSPLSLCHIRDSGHGAAHHRCPAPSCGQDACSV